MRRKKATVWLTLASCFLAGCQKPYFMTQVDYVYYNEICGNAQPKEIEDASIVTQFEPRSVRSPAERERWELPLGEAKRIALENNKQIAVVAYQPGEAGTDIDTQLSAFDPFFAIGGGWSRTDRQAASALNTGFNDPNSVFKVDSFGGAVGSGPYGFNLTDGAEAGFVSTTQRPRFAVSPGDSLIGITKRNVTGGQSSIGYNLDYQKNVPAAFQTINPFWRSSLTYGLQQPLLQGAGVEFNRAPILIARATQEQTIKNFDRDVRTLLRDVETAYWQLYFTYQDLYSRETGMKQALATWQKEKNKQEVGTGAVPDVAQAREQYEFFRAARVQALARTLQSERELRELLGLPPEDGRQVIPKDDPVIAEYEPNWQQGVIESMELRPELSAQRFAIRAAELELFRQKNGLLPDLTFVGNYTITGLSDEFDGSVNVLKQNDYQDWYLGIRYRRQIGERTANAAVRRAQLGLSRQRATLRNLEHTIIHALYTSYQNLITQYELIQVQKDRRQAATDQLIAREQFYRQGKTTIDVLLQAQNAFADALRDESQAIVQYNQALVEWEFNKGTILINDNVALAEERISVADPKQLKERKWQWSHVCNLPLPRGQKVHNDFWPCPDCSGPLYSPSLWNSPQITDDVSTNPESTEQDETFEEKRDDSVDENKVETGDEPTPMPPPANPQRLPSLDDSSARVPEMHYEAVGASEELAPPPAFTEMEELPAPLPAAAPAASAADSTPERQLVPLKEWPFPAGMGPQE